LLESSYNDSWESSFSWMLGLCSADCIVVVWLAVCDEVVSW
jgi:hypothetical protein